MSPNTRLSRWIAPLAALCLALLLPVSAVASNTAALAPAEGVDYEVISGGRELNPMRGKIEVAEVFGYTCIHCANFEPRLAAWHARLPKDVEFVAVAAAFGGYWIPYAKAFYAARSLGVAERTHGAMFRAVHEERSLPINQATAQEIAGFYAVHGVDPQQFVAAFEGAQVAAELERTRDFVMRSGVEGTPTLIIAGKYRVPAGSPRSLQIAEYLIARERAARAASAPAHAATIGSGG